MLSMKLRLGSEFSSSDPTYNPNVARVGVGDRVIIDVQSVGILTWPGLPSNVAQSHVVSFGAGLWIPPVLDVKAVHPHTQTNGWNFLPFAYDAASGLLFVGATGATDLKGLGGATLCSIECYVKPGSEGQGGVVSLFSAKLAGQDVPAMGAEFHVERALYRAAFEDITVAVGQTAKLRLVLSDASGVQGAPAPVLAQPYLSMHTRWDLNTEIAKITGSRVVMGGPALAPYLPPLREQAYANGYVVDFKWNKGPGYNPLPALPLPYGPLVELDVLGVKAGTTPLNMLNAGISATPNRIPALYGDGMITVGQAMKQIP